jgi:DNA-binding NarL/FixJ family response regulator
MNLTSLLVCSDDRALRVLRSVLGELEIDVEHCADHAIAAKEIALRPFGAVIIDCADDQSFTLLKTLRAGKQNCKSMTIAIVEARTNLQAAFQLGANFVVFKPISTEKAKSSFRAARALMKRERRRSVRLAVNIAAYFRFQNGDGEQASISTLSEGGISVRFSGSPGKKSGPVGLSFALPDSTTVIEATGTIAWQDRRNHAGIQFAMLPEASLQSLKEWLRLQSGEKRDPPIRCALIGLSFGGCFLRTQSPFPPQTRVEMLLRAADRSIKTEGKVRLTDPELGMGIEFISRTPEQRERLHTLVRQMMDSPDAIAEVLVEPEGIDWEQSAGAADSAEKNADHANADSLLELFRKGATLSKAQFLLELEKHELTPSTGDEPELEIEEAVACHRREPRIAVTLPVQVAANEQPEPSAHATHFIDVSHHGARVGGIIYQLKPGEVVSLVSNGCEARFIVIWIGEPGTPQEGQIGLQSLTVEN